ncbi:MAG: RNA polymerase sporulation sigma factor SigG [Bacillota bacterium]
MKGYNKVEISGVNSFELPVLSAEEMRCLFRRLQAGETAIRETIIQGNLKLVLSVLQRFKNRGENMDDLFQIGCIGLMKAVDNFSLDHNVQFSTYAVPMILGEIKRCLRDNNYIHMSRSLKATAQKLQEIRELLLQKYEREPSVAEIASEMQISPEEVVLAVNAGQEPVSIFEPVFNDSSDPVNLMELLTDMENGDEHWLENIEMREALEKLALREKYIIIARFFQGKTQEEVARCLGISQAQISRIEKAALGRLRRYYTGQAMDKDGAGQQGSLPC